MLNLALLWIFWCALHSLSITSSVQSWFREKGGAWLGLYRLGYVTFSTLSLIPLLLYQHSLPQQQLFSWQGYGQIVSFFLLGYAVIMFWAGKKNYDMGYFLGLSQWQAYRLRQAPQTFPFRCSGILCYVRHPWYSGGLALLWGHGPITNLGLLVRVILTAYFIIGTLLEEQKLRRELGAIYVRYCQEVPMLIPWRGKVSFSVTNNRHP